MTLLSALPLFSYHEYCQPPRVCVCVCCDGGDGKMKEESYLLSISSLIISIYVNKDHGVLLSVWHLVGPQLNH